MNPKLTKEVTTFMPPLIKAVQLTDGPVLELGAGVFSTPLLHWLCAESRRKLVTCEANPEYYAFARRFLSRNHRVALINDWGTIDTQTHWSVVLVDQDADRDRTAIMLKDTADYIILHDSEAEKLYGYDKVYPHFKNIFHWTFCRPHTTVISNFYDLSNFKV